MTHHIYAIGGCHIEGHLVGAENSFLSAYLENKNIDGTTIWGSIKIEKVISALDVQSDFKEGGVFIIQLGHYEVSSNSFYPSYINRSQNTTLLEKIHQFRTKYKIRFIEEIFKTIILIYRDIARNSPTSPIAFNLQINELFRKISLLVPTHVIVLSCFPTKSFARNIYRKRLNKILRTETSKFGFQYVDVYSALMLASKKKIDIFVDDAHLNATGHRLVSNKINECIQEFND